MAQHVAVHLMSDVVHGTRYAAVHNIKQQSSWHKCAAVPQNMLQCVAYNAWQ